MRKDIIWSGSDRIRITKNDGTWFEYECKDLQEVSLIRFVAEEK